MARRSKEGRVFFDYIRYLNIGDEITITNFLDTLFLSKNYSLFL